MAQVPPEDEARLPVPGDADDIFSVFHDDEQYAQADEYHTQAREALGHQRHRDADRAQDGAERDIARQQKGQGEHHEGYDARVVVDDEGGGGAAEDALAAPEAVEHREDVAQDQAEGRKQPAHAQVFLLQQGVARRKAEHQPAYERREHTLCDVYAQDARDALGAVVAVKIREPRVAAAHRAHVAVEKVTGYDDGPVYAA